MMLDSVDRLSTRALLIWGVALVVALWLAMTSLGGFAQVAAPRLALSVFPQSGFAYESLATSDVLTGDVPMQKIRISDADIADARAALRREPFATTALTLIGISQGLHGNQANAAKTVAAAHRLDKRQLLANAWLINRYGVAGRDSEVLALLDEALKIRPELSIQYMPALAQALQNPETVSAFQVLLSSHPDWEKSFWEAAARNKAALPNAQVLRERILAGPENTGPTDSMLMAAFIAAGRLDLAFGYAKDLPSLADDRGNFLRDSSFSQLPQMPPLDWELTNDGRVGAAIDEGRGTLELNALGGAAGIVARQLVALPPGSYELLIKLGQAELARGSEIEAHLHCAEPGNTSTPVADHVTDDLDRSFVVPDASCRFFWLDLNFSAIDSSEPVIASIADVRIRPGRVPIEK